MRGEQMYPLLFGVLGLRALGCLGFEGLRVEGLSGRAGVREGAAPELARWLRSLGRGALPSRTAPGTGEVQFVKRNGPAALPSTAAAVPQAPRDGAFSAPPPGRTRRQSALSSGRRGGGGSFISFARGVIPSDGLSAFVQVRHVHLTPRPGRRRAPFAPGATPGPGARSSSRSRSRSRSIRSTTTTHVRSGGKQWAMGIAPVSFLV